MRAIDLGGSWQFNEVGREETWMGRLPGSNYLALMDAGVIEDPFWGQNEETAKEIGEKDYRYTRTFSVDGDFLAQDDIRLTIAQLDTVAAIHINDKVVGQFDNAHRLYDLPVKAFLKAGDNEISILFKSPQGYIREKHEENPTFNMGMAPYAAQIRKPECHFGWDWGPVLPPSGIQGRIALEGYSTARLADLKIEQEHADGKVTLHVTESVERLGASEQTVWVRVNLTAPDGTVQTLTTQVEGDSTSQTIVVENPHLWWCNGLGEQPLYSVTAAVLDGEDADSALDEWERKIGLRTIRLDTAADEWGKNFCFYVNEVPIFTKGGDWVPSDSFVTRTTREDLEFYMRSAKEANMNMLRVWGGGYYESETFYDLCDEYGILVWQDCAFACVEYPLSDAAFLQNVREEIHDQVRRLRHRASLALWCGNNEIKMISRMFKKGKGALHDEFFFHTLRDWVREDDDVTPYWASSPSSNEIGTKANALTEGDTHLWQVWHGMQPLESFRNYPTRFCSEFGVESLPSMLAIRSFTDLEDPGLFDDVIQAHQKSAGGNEKMLYYILSKYRHPGNLEDFIYLSQLIQSETVRMATEFWRRNSARCHGAIYWQYNDTWPVASWAGIDYLQQFKALQYRAKHFNAMVCVSAEMHSKRADIYGINDLNEAFTGSLCWRLVDFDGQVIATQSREIEIGQNESVQLETVSFKEALDGHDKQTAALVLELKDADGTVISRQHNLLVADKEASLPKPNFTTQIAQRGKQGVLTIEADHYSRYTWVQLDGITTPLSDNFFDMEAGETREITFAVPEGMRAEAVRVKVKDLTAVSVTGSVAHDKWLRAKMFLRPGNLLFYIVMKFLM